MLLLLLCHYFPCGCLEERWCSSEIPPPREVCGVRGGKAWALHAFREGQCSALSHVIGEGGVVRCVTGGRPAA